MAWALLLCWGGVVRRLNGVVLGLTVALLLLCIRLGWQGDPLAVGVAVALLGAMVSASNRQTPYLFETFFYLLDAAILGCRPLIQQIRHCLSRRLISWRIFERQFSLPAFVLVVFGAIFVLANPNFRDWVVATFDELAEFLVNALPDAPRVLFWLGIAWVTAGWLRPGINRLLIIGRKTRPTGPMPDRSNLESHYATARNTLASVVVMFALYLAYEITVMCLREFPDGFYYSGYAHEGAFWLTVALAFSTFTLGLVMRSGLLSHPQAGRLRKLAWCWTFENLVLAACVFNRLQIYVDFNGMSRMRVVACLGVAAVVVGFLLAVFKVLRERSLYWLIQRDLWALFGVVFLWCLMPVDALVTRYNVAQISRGNPAPAVQLAWHPISTEGAPQLLPLVDHPHPDIRGGVRALLAQAQTRVRSDSAEHWANTQASHTYARQRLAHHESAWDEYALDPEARTAALERFQTHTRQWY